MKACFASKNEAALTTQYWPYLKEQIIFVTGAQNISCAGYIFWLDEVGIDEASYPNVQRWLARMRALPAWKHPDEAMKPKVD